VESEGLKVRPIEEILTMIRASVARAVRTVNNQLPFLVIPGDFTMSWRELLRLKRAPRHTLMRSRLLGRTIEFTDSTGYLFVYREVLLDQIYRFVSHRSNPFIIDCGANIGLSLLYFKHLYPNARMIAFEPDPQNFAVLQRNVKAFGLPDVALHQKAVWNAEADLAFQATGSLASRVLTEEGGIQTIRVSGARLKDYLSEPIDFLKLDIEGAERDVLLDCADSLTNVDHLFVEYHGYPGEQQGLGDVLRVIQAAGFRYHIKDAFLVEHPFVEAQRGGQVPLQLNIFAYREVLAGSATGQ
jgi:FkbM family methyltransferase